VRYSGDGHVAGMWSSARTPDMLPRRIAEVSERTSGCIAPYISPRPCPSSINGDAGLMRQSKDARTGVDARESNGLLLHTYESVEVSHEIRALGKTEC